MAEEIQNFFASQPVAGIERTISQTVELISARAFEIESMANNLNEWLKNN